MYKKTVKRFISIVLAVVMLISVFAIDVSAAYTGISRTEAEVRAVLDSIMQEFPVGSCFTANGKQCTHAAIETCNNCRLSGVLGRSDVTSSCANAGIDKGLFYAACWTCQAFASYCYTRCFGLPGMGTSTNKTYTASNYVTITKQSAPTAATVKNLLSAAKPGDLIYISTIPHWIVFYGYTSDGITYIDNNGDLNNTGHAKQLVDKTSVTYAKLATKGKSGYISLLHCKYYTGSGSSSPDPVKAVSWNNLYVSDIKQTSAVVKADLSANASLLKTVGLQMCKDGGTLTTVASWSVGSVLNYCYVNCDGSEAPALSAGTKYNYRFFVVRTDGTYEYSDQKSFTTSQSTATSAIKWDSVTASSITATSALVKADVTATTSQIKTIGLQMCKSGGSLSSVASWPVGSVLNYCYVACDGSEAPALSPNTTYQYRFYIIRNDGTYEYSDTKSFTTLTGTSSAITWDNVYVSNITDTSAMVKADVTAKPSQIKTIGLQLCKDGGQLTSVASWPVGSILNYCYVACDGSEGPKLSPGTKYYYCFYILRTDGSYEYSATKSFTTTCSHSNNSGVITKAATCTTAGIRTYTCTKCGATTTETIAALGHNYQTTVVPSTCQMQGYTAHQCTRCNSGYKDSYTPQAAHTYLNGVCTVCGEPSSVGKFDGIYEFSEPYRNSIFYMMLNQVELTGDQRVDIVRIAQSQIGYQEGLSYADLDGALNNGQTQAKNMSYLDNGTYKNYKGYLDACEYNYWRWSGSTGGRYISSLQSTKPAGAAYDVSTYDRAWCATFVAWCARMAGIPTGIMNNSTYACPLSGCMNIPYFENGTYTPKSGDIIYFGTTAWEHVGIIESVDGETITYIDGNGDDNVSRHTVSMSNSRVRAFGVPSYNGISDLPAITWKNIYVSNITNNSAVVKADVTANTGVLKTIGLQMCKTGGSMETVASWAVNNVLNYCYVNCDGSEAPKLSPNTSYSYRFFVEKTDGTYEYSDAQSFTTLATSASVITWDSVTVSDIKETSATVKADVTANAGSIKTIGLMLCEDGGTLRSVASWGVGNVLNYCYVNCNGSEGPVLSPGTTYQYCFYIIREDGAYEYTPVKSFTTQCVHVYDNGMITVAPTCTQAGEQVLTCTKCGNTKTASADALGHNWNSGVQTIVPTATASGEICYTCERCGSKTTSVVPPLNHVHSYAKVLTSPTCTEYGYTTYTCECGETYLDNYIAPLGHSYANGLCIRCGEKDPTPLPCSHEYDAGAITAAPTCTAAGEKTFTCTKCGDKKLMTIEALGHTWDSGTQTKAPTETTAGEIRYICTRCGTFRSESIPELSHTHKYTAAVTAPTCTEGGYTTYRCTCGESYLDNNTAPLGHSYANGLCIRCGEKDPNKTQYSFTDVQQKAYYYRSVLWAAGNGVTTGYSDNTFRPDAVCTRGQVVTFLWRTAGCPKAKNDTNPFTDVKKGAYYYDAVLWAVEAGVTTGMSATTFQPDGQCTRGQVVTFLWRAKGSPKAENKNNPFTDVKSGAYYYNAVLWAVENGITTGFGQGIFQPNGQCTRGQVVTFLWRTEGSPTT